MRRRRGCSSTAACGGARTTRWRRLHARARWLGGGTIRARLYAIDWYSGAVASDDPADVVHGDVFEFEPATAAETIAALDAYEGEGFARREVEVRMETGGTAETLLRAQAYLFAASVAGLPWIAHGRWPRQARRNGESG
jgi:gamma-glutamylcyclotransferase (GGCT)/AIG2-like uncharacterized protein YtfP